MNNDELPVLFEFFVGTELGFSLVPFRVKQSFSKCSEQIEPFIILVESNPRKEFHFPAMSRFFGILILSM